MGDGRMKFDALAAALDDEDDLDLQKQEEEDESTRGKCVPEHWAAVVSAINYSVIRQTPGSVPEAIFRNVILANYYDTWKPEIWHDVSNGIRACGLATVTADSVYVFVDLTQVPPTRGTRLVLLNTKRLERLYRHELSGNKPLHLAMLDVEPGQPFPEAPVKRPTEPAPRIQKKSPQPKAPPPPDPKLLALAALATERQGVLLPKTEAVAIISAVLGPSQAVPLLEALDHADMIYLSGDDVILPLSSMLLGQDYARRHRDHLKMKP